MPFGRKGSVSVPFIEGARAPDDGASGFANAALALDYLFSSFGNRHQFHAGRLDRDFRRPEVLPDLARRLGVLPTPLRTCLVTGSKGKGTVSRQIAWNLAAAGRKVGLVLSPEELDHLDRIRIGNRTIPETDFCRLLSGVRGLLDKVLAEQPADYYFPPSGLFLLIAWIWFREQGVDTWVLEGGRGVRFDEIGQIEAGVGVVTNVLGEHLARLGPRLEDIAADKLSLGKRCQTLVIGESVGRWRHLTPPGCSEVIAAGSSGGEPGTPQRPAWFDELGLIARAAAHRLCPDLPWRTFDSPAFFFARGGLREGRIAKGTVCCDAAIHRDCLDSEFLRRTGLYTGAALIGLTDDKDGDGIVRKLTAAGFRHIYTVTLSSRVGHIRPWIAAEGRAEQVADMDVIGNAGSGFRDTISALAERHGCLYIVGVQVFIRSLRQALKIGLIHPNN